MTWQKARKALLVIGGLLAVLAAIGARREVVEVEREAALWAEATDPLG